MIVAWKHLLAGQHQAVVKLASTSPRYKLIATLCSGALATVRMLAGQHRTTVGPAMAFPEG